MNPRDVDTVGVRSLSASVSEHTFEPLSDAGDYDLSYKSIDSAKLQLLPVASSSLGSPENLPWHFDRLDQHTLTDGELKAEIEKARGDIPNRKAALAHRKPKSSHAETAKEARNTEPPGATT